MKKLYYSMGEVSKLTGLAPHVLRNWEKNFPDLNPNKNSAGNRAYKESEVELLFRIKELLMDKKYTSEGVNTILKGETEEISEPDKLEMNAQIKRDLTEMRVFLNNLLEKL